MPDNARQLAASRLGETAGRLVLSNRGQFRDTCLLMAQQATRSIDIFSHDLDPPLFDQQAFLEALKSLVLNHRKSVVRVLLQDNQRVRSHGHRLVQLARRLSSHVEIRRPHADHRSHAENFLIANRTGYIRRPLPSQYQGEADFHNPLQASRLAEFFQEAWEHGEPDSELRQLDL